jgi:hypothetical protein
MTIVTSNRPKALHVLQPRQRVGSFFAPENLEHRLGEVLGYPGDDR